MEVGKRAAPPSHLATSTLNVGADLTMNEFEFYEKHRGQMEVEKDCYDIKNILSASFTSASNLEIISPIKCDLTIGESTISALIDSGASANFMRPDIAEKLEMPVHKLDTPLVVELADKTTRKCTDYVLAYTSADRDADSATQFAIADMPQIGTRPLWECPG